MPAERHRYPALAGGAQRGNDVIERPFEFVPALLAKFIFRITPSVPALLLIVGALAVCVVTVITGMLSGRGVTNHPPLEVLRQET